MGEPQMLPMEGSEIEGVIDTAHVGDDNIRRPIHLNQDTELFFLTVEDAKRLLEFLNEAIPYLEEQDGMRMQ